VTAGEAFDALAWVDGIDVLEQIDSLEIEGERTLRATGETLRYLGETFGERRDARAL
jgi:hypothetical protein